MRKQLHVTTFVTLLTQDFIVQNGHYLNLLHYNKEFIIRLYYLFL